MDPFLCDGRIGWRRRKRPRLTRKDALLLAAVVAVCVALVVGMDKGTDWWSSRTSRLPDAASTLQPDGSASGEGGYILVDPQGNVVRRFRKDEVGAYRRFFGKGTAPTPEGADPTGSR